MTIKEKMLRTVEEHRMTQPGDRVAVALSGGGDSVCLLFLLSSLKDKLGITLSAVHVHHGLRENADADEAFVKELCRSLEIPLTVFRVDTPALVRAEGLSVEEAARKLRYEAFEQVEADRVALAHHMDDQAETVLLRLMRGSGLRGIGGMRAVRDRYIRPLIDVSSAEIEAYLAEQALPHCEDETNGDLSYARNRVRRELVPYLREHFSEGVTETIARSAKLWQEDEDCLCLLAEQAFKDMGEVLSREALAALPKALRTRVIRLAVARKNGLYNLGEKSVELVDRLVLSERGSGSVSLPDGLTMVLKSGIIQPYSTVEFYGLSEAERQGQNGAFPLPVPGAVRLPDGAEIGAEYTVSPGKAAILAAGETEKWGSFPVEGLCVRSRKAGDYITIFDNNHSLCRKSLQDFFVDVQIPAEERDRTMLVARDSEILWIIGHRLGDGLRLPDPEDKTAPVIHLYYKKP